MAALVTENWSEYQIQRNKSAFRGFVATGVASAAEAVLELQSQKGVAAGVSHDEDNRLVAEEPNVRTSKSPNRYDIGVTYSRPGVGGGLGPGGGTDPLDLPVEWRRRTAPRDESTDVDASDPPLAILNTAGQPFQSDITRPFGGSIYTASRYESTYSEARADQFEQTVNLTTVSIPRIGTFAPGRLLLLSYEPEDNIKASGPQPPILCTYSFERRSGFRQDADGLWDGFKFRIRNEGFMGWWDDDGTPTLGDFVTAKGERVSEPVLLTKDGMPIDATIKVQGEPGTMNDPIAAPNTFSPSLIEETGTAVFLKYLKYKALNWGGLALF